MKVSSARPKALQTTLQKKMIRYKQYKEATFEQKTFRHGTEMQRSEGHDVYDVHINKVSLSLLDTKRWIADDCVQTSSKPNLSTSSSTVSFRLTS